jgi:DNA polymerase alpha-associated DNA helicase A
MPPRTTTKLSPQAFATTQLHLLDQESRTEVAENTLLLSSSPPQTLARAGLAILNLTVISQKTGLGGRTVLELGLDPAIKSGNDDLPEHGIRTGDIVRVSEQPKGGAKKRDAEALKTKGVEGVVTRVGQRAVWVAAGKDGSKDDDDVDALGEKLWLVKLANDVTFKRMNQVMVKLSKMAESEYTGLMRVLFGLSSPGVPDMEKVKDIKFIDETLNDSQKDAIRFALASSDVALIHGPPGTGKTHTLIELILQMLKQKLRIMVCGPSNISVDNIVERLAPHKVPMVRLGHPARLLPSVLNHSLEVLTRTSEAAGIVQDVRKEMDEKQASIRKTRNGRERRAIYGEMKELRKEFREREGKCVENLVTSSKVVLATLHGSGGFQLKRQEFDVVIIDEASQALEAQCWVPLLGAKKVVLAGDPFQLPPTVKSNNEKQDKAEKKKDKQRLEDELSKLSVADSEKKTAAKCSLEMTMFDRLLALHGPDIKKLLNTQYRMNEKIMRFPSDELYESKLVAADSVKDRLLVDLPYKVEETEDTRESLVFFDTQGGDFPEKTEDDSSEKRSVILGDSKSNEMEASLVGMHVKNLVAAGVKPEDIAIITPYNAQLAVLSQLLKEKYSEMEFGSVDGFQGREKEAVIVSLVRSNPEHEVGFLGEERRLNGRYLLSSFRSRGSNHHAGGIDDGRKDPMRGVGLFMSRCQECIRCRIMSLTTEFHSCHDKTQATSRDYRRLGNSIKVRPLQVILEDGAFPGSEILTDHKTGVALS